MLEVKFNTRELERALVFTPQALKIELQDGLEHIRRSFFKRFRETRLKGPRPERIVATPGPGGLFVRFQHRTFPASEGVENMGFEIYTDSKIARLHEEGGTITAKGGHGLAVPLSAREEMFTAKGKLKKRYKTPSRLRNVREMRLKGQLFLVRFWKKRREIKPLYVLKNRIRIRPRLGFFKTWEDLAPRRIEILNKSISKALKRKR